MTETVWLVGFTRTGRLAHAVRPSSPGAATTFVTYCGAPAIKHTFGPWSEVNEDVLCCSRCFEMRARIHADLKHE